MVIYLVRMFGISLMITIVAELAVAFFFGLGTGKGILLVTFVNVFTNPPAVLCNWLCRLYLPDYRRMPVQLVIEAVVVLAEALIYHCFAKDERWRIKSPVLLSLTANGCSWLLGAFLQMKR